jgi:hypothetical protein
VAGRKDDLMAPLCQQSRRSQANASGGARDQGKLREALSNNPVRSGVGFDLPEVSSFSLDRVPLGPDSVDSR